MSTERSYQSSLREEQAQRTRTRIRTAARRLFGRQGFTATTVAEIAREAGVAPATVYAAYESKAGIVTAMLDDMEESIEVGRRIQAILKEPDPHTQLRRYASAHVDLFANGADVLRAALQAIDAPEVAALWERGDRQRRVVIDALTGQWHEKRALKRGLTPEIAAERLWLLTTVEGFLNATDRLGWAPDQYERWIGDLAEAELLTSPSSQRGAAA